MTVGFILCASLLSLWIGCAVYAGLFVVYAAVNYKSVASLFRKIFKRKSSPAVAGQVENEEIQTENEQTSEAEGEE